MRNYSTKKKLPVRACVLALACLLFFALAIDMASGFLVGGPTLKAADLGCERLDFEDDVP